MLVFILFFRLKQYHHKVKKNSFGKNSQIENTRNRFANTQTLAIIVKDKTTMPQPIFYFDKLKLWDKITISLYIFLTVGLWYYFDIASNYKTQRDILFGYGFGTQIFFYLVNYKSLRNLTVYFFWVVVGFFHLFVYFHLREIPLLQNIRGHSATGLRNTIILLLLFQVLRFVSARTQGQELVCPSRGSRTDLFDERRVTLIDFILFVIYMGTTIILLFND